MKALIAVEFRRLVSRRLWRGLSIVLLVAFAFFGTMAFIGSDDSPQAVAAAEARYEQEIDRCVADVESVGVGEEYPPSAEADPVGFCNEAVWEQDPRFAYREMDWIMSMLAIPMLMLGWLLGASAMGAEWQSRSMTTMLTWEPRRGRVLAAKLVAVMSLAFLWVLAAQIILALAFYPAGEFEGSMAGVDAAWLRDFGGMLLRVAGIGAGASAFGFFLATIGRNTAAALGAGFVYLTAVEGLIRAFKPEWIDWLIGDNAGLVMAGPAHVTHLSHSQGSAALLLAAYATALGVVAYAFFRRREVA